MNFIGLLRTLEQITRTPKMGHDLDVEDGAEQLAEREAETECLVPEDFNAVCECADCVAEERESGTCYFCGSVTSTVRATDDGDGEFVCDDCSIPNPTEPPLTPDELVGVRGLLQERASSDGILWGPQWRMQAPSPTIVQSAPPPTVDGGAGGGGVLHSPGARLPHPDDTAAEWIGEAVPVISELLTKHFFYLANHSSIGSEDHCLCGHRPRGALAWNAHIAPIIANALAPHDKPTGYAAIHDLRQAADLIGALDQPDDPRDYDYGALAERLSAAADHLAQQDK